MPSLPNETPAQDIRNALGLLRALWNLQARDAASRNTTLAVVRLAMTDFDAIYARLIAAAEKLEAWPTDAQVRAAYDAAAVACGSDRYAPTPDDLTAMRAALVAAR